MFFMNGGYAVAAVIMILLLYFGISFFNQDKNSIAVIFQGVIFQFSRQLQVFLQKADKEQVRSWRPSAVAISEDSFQRLGAMRQWAMFFSLTLRKEKILNKSGQ